MKATSFTIVVIAGWLMSGSAFAEVNYPWCIITGGTSEGVYSCGYVSLAQCQATRIGTDMCVPNPRYQPGPARERIRR